MGAFYALFAVKLAKTFADVTGAMTRHGKNTGNGVSRGRLRARACLSACFVLPPLALADDVGPAASEEPIEPNGEQKSTWIDASHEYATNRAQALAQWMDDFFGAQVVDSERADSFVRAIVADDWDELDGHDLKMRLRGQVSLPKISERVDLFFSGEEAEQTLTEDEREQESDVGVRLNFRDSKRTRIDATLSVRSGPALLPGVRFRYQQPISDNSWGRVTQRLEYHTDDGYRSRTNFDLNRALDDKRLLRWGGRIRYREDREYWDWNTGVTYRTALEDHSKYPSAVEYFIAMSGRNEPNTFATNYRVGVLYRKQFMREFLFVELEPSYNWRRDEYEDERQGVLGIVLRLEVMLDEDLVRRNR